MSQIYTKHSSWASCFVLLSLSLHLSLSLSLSYISLPLFFKSCTHSFLTSCLFTHAVRCAQQVYEDYNGNFGFINNLNDRHITLNYRHQMEFACSHVVCNWTSDSLTEDETKLSNQGSTSTLPCDLSRAVSEHPYDNRVTVTQKPTPSLVPPPVPPRNIQQKHILSSTLPPPIPPRGLENNEEAQIKANVNVVSLQVGSLVDISKDSAIQSNQKPVHCGKCNAIMSFASNPEINQNTTMWCCEFCGKENVYPLTALKGGRFSLRTPPGRDILYMEDNEVDYENLENMLIVFCVDISGSMSVTAEISPGNSMRSPTYISRLQGVQEALQMVLSNLLKTSPQRRVALVTFNNEVTVYGDGKGVPLSLRDWALVDYDYLKKEGENHSTPHCIAETIQPLTQKIKELREHGATALGPAALISVAMASQFTGSKVIICTDGQANIGLGQLEQESSHCPAPSPYFYNQLACYAAEKGVIVSVMTFEGEDCRLAEVGRLADSTGGRINIVNIGTVATEIQSAIADNILATSVMATLLVPDGMYFPYEEDGHRLVREIGNVTDKVEITFQFAVRAEKVESFQKRDRVPFQLQLSFRTRDLQKVTRVITLQKRVTTSSWVWAGSLNMSVLGVHCAQLCARLTMEGKVKEAQRQLKAQQDLLKGISEQKPSPKEESIYGNWISTMSMICEDLTTPNQNTTETEALPTCQTSNARWLVVLIFPFLTEMRRRPVEIGLSPQLEKPYRGNTEFIYSLARQNKRFVISTPRVSDSSTSSETAAANADVCANKPTAEAPAKLDKSRKF